MCVRDSWWGHRIPAYFLPEGGYVVAETEEKALELAKEKCGNRNLTMSDLRQDEEMCIRDRYGCPRPFEERCG